MRRGFIVWPSAGSQVERSVSAEHRRRVRRRVQRHPSQDIASWSDRGGGLPRQAGLLHCIAAAMVRPDTAPSRPLGGRCAWTSSIRVLPTARPGAHGMAVRPADCEVRLDAPSEAGGGVRLTRVLAVKARRRVNSSLRRDGESGCDTSGSQRSWANLANSLGYLSAVGPSPGRFLDGLTGEGAAKGQ